LFTPTDYSSLIYQEGGGREERERGKRGKRGKRERGRQGKILNSEFLNS
jgi:hypothetical protein